MIWTSMGPKKRVNWIQTVGWWSLKMQDKNPCIDQLVCAFLSVLDILHSR